jgi:hypothetical protein
MDPEALRWRKIPWAKIPQLSRAGVLPFLSVKDNVEFDIALLNDEECRDDYLLSHKNKEGLPAYDNWVYRADDNFQGLRWVMKRCIKLNALQMRVGVDGETDRDRVLHWLVDMEHGDIAKEYVRINTDVRDVVGLDYFGRTTLALSASKQGYVEVVNTLITTGADVNKASNNGMTPISWASFKGHLEVVQALVAAGADVNKASNNGMTPISRASCNGHLMVVQALIAAGADVNKADNGDSTPISRASCNGHLMVVQALIAAGATPLS